MILACFRHCAPGWVGLCCSVAALPAAFPRWRVACLMLRAAFFLLHGLCMGLFGLQRVPRGPLWRDFVLLFGWLSVFFCLVASCLHAKHKKIMARSGLCPFLVLDLPFFRGFWGRFSAHCGALGVASSGSPALQICPVSWVSCAAGGSDRLGLGFLIGAPSGLASARVVLCLRLPDRCPDRCRWRVVWRGWSVVRLCCVRFKFGRFCGF